MLSRSWLRRSQLRQRWASRSSSHRGFAITEMVDDSLLTYQLFFDIVDTSAKWKELIPMPDRTVSVLRTHDDRLIPVAGIYDIDAPHTSVEFVGRHLMITKVRGRFNDVRGRITIAEEPENSHAEVEIGVASLSTGNDDRDAHLKSADFFDVEHHPTITFASTAVRALREDTWELVGNLSVHGTTRA